MVYSYYEIGRRIIEQEQKGKLRAEYGERIIQLLSKELTKDFGRGYSLENLRLMRRFYLAYSSNQISQTVSTESNSKAVINKNLSISQTVSTESNSKTVKSFDDEISHFPLTPDGHRFCLSWSMYVVLMKIPNIYERRFYEIESYRNKWSVRELERQYGSLLFDRLVKSKDKTKVMELATKGQIIENPKDVFKNPTCLEFLGLKEDETYTEKELENRIMNHLQEFMLELGKGFIFVGRQYRLCLEGSNFYCDLVFYNRYLKCFVIIDLKMDKLTHDDLGQMMMYVNYFDQEVKLPDEKPTIGLILSRGKNKAMVQYTLGKGNENIYTSDYSTILPSKEDLEKIISQDY